MKQKTIEDDTISVEDLLEIAHSFQQSRVFLTACELGIFTILGSGQKTSKEIAGELGADERATDRILNALTALDIIKKQGTRFSNSKSSLKFFTKGQPEFLGNLLHLTHSSDRWRTLTESVKLGTAVQYKDIQDKSDAWLSSYIASNHWYAKLHAPEIADIIDLSKIERLLDIGGGSGAYSMEFVKIKPQLKAVVFDMPKIIPYTKEYLESSGFGNKIETIAGNYFTDDFGKNYDMVFISYVCQNHTIWENLELMRRVFDALKFGGTVVIQEFLINDDRTSPVNGALLSLNMLVNTRAGDAYTETDLWLILRESWFSKIHRIDTHYGTSLMIGKK
ncbi:MAG: hypothetical protein QG635_1251 [Bacteroidota bacterium]|nr:hypothetical protein [Bacteroidota bacterium]